ncbi:MAG: hypothetical protein Q3992_03925 [Bacteroides sp.]|nr:hypothetical protein [Bacteroides sp.]
MKKNNIVSAPELSAEVIAKAKVELARIRKANVTLDEVYKVLTSPCVERQQLLSVLNQKPIINGNIIIQSYESNS